eukprot:gene29057-35071_t
MKGLREKGLSWDAVHIPSCLLNTEIVIGIDEAGRGPVLGSLIYCAAFWPVSMDEEIKKMGFDDSKALKEGERDQMMKEILEHGSIGWVINEIDAEKISEEMLRPSPTSLNTLSYDGVIQMLQTIYNSHPTQAPTIGNVFIDTVGDPETYKLKLENALGKDFANFTIEKKADAKYKPVSCASIIAKVTRDSLLRGWEYPEEKAGSRTWDRDFGSGYPGDEHAVKWLERSYDPIFGYPNLVRFSWSTVKEVLGKRKAVEARWDCEEEEDVQSTQDISTFFGGPSPSAAAVLGQGVSRRPRSAFFAKRKLKRLTQAREIV